MHTLDLHKIIFNESFDALQELRRESNDEGIDSWLSKGKVAVDKLSYDKNIVKDIYYKKIKDYFNQ